MKNILITGAGSYIGVSLENYLGKWPENYRGMTSSMFVGCWISTVVVPEEDRFRVLLLS